MGYIFLTGNPYCNSARYCELLCAKSPLTRGSQSISRGYRICAHFLLSSVVAMVSVGLQGRGTSVYVVGVAFVLGLFLATFLVSLHADATESILVVFLLDEYFATKEAGAWLKEEFNDEVVKHMRLKTPLAGQISKLFNKPVLESQ